MSSAEAAIQNLKEAITKAHVLAVLDISKEFIVKWDGGRSAIWAVLTQEQPIAFFTQAL